MTTVLRTVYLSPSWNNLLKKWAFASEESAADIMAALVEEGLDIAEGRQPQAPVSFSEGVMRMWVELMGNTYGTQTLGLHTEGSGVLKTIYLPKDVDNRFKDAAQKAGLKKADYLERQIVDGLIRKKDVLVSYAHKEAENKKALDASKKSRKGRAKKAMSDVAPVAAAEPEPFDLEGFSRMAAQLKGRPIAFMRPL